MRPRLKINIQRSRWYTAPNQEGAYAQTDGVDPACRSAARGGVAQARSDAAPAGAAASPVVAERGDAGRGRGRQAGPLSPDGRSLRRALQRPRLAGAAAGGTRTRAPRSPAAPPPDRGGPLDSPRTPGLWLRGQPVELQAVGAPCRQDLETATLR